MIVFTTSLSFEQHVRRCLDGVEEVAVARSQRGLPAYKPDSPELILVHSDDQRHVIDEDLIKSFAARPAVVVVASDTPSVEEFLQVSGVGVRAYINSYMADVHYAQMLEVVRGGQSWVVPSILDQALAVARSTHVSSDRLAALDLLTPRQRQIAIDVAEGLSNRDIAGHLGITEPTVKVHLGKIFKKLDVKSRFELAVQLQGLREAS